MKWSRGFALCTALTLQLSCNHVSTQRFLDADFLSREGQTSPTLIAPLNNSAAALDTVFSWSMVPGALKYRIEMSAVQDFSTVRLRAEIKTTNYTIATSDIRGAASLPQQNYYWRVTAIFFFGRIGFERVSLYSTG